VELVLAPDNRQINTLCTLHKLMKGKHYLKDNIANEIGGGGKSSINTWGTAISPTKDL
jgi:hypothetical protein